MNNNSNLTLYKLNKQLLSSIDLFDLLEAYYPEKHNTIVRMRNIAYKELIESGILTADGVISCSCPDLLYKNILNTCIPTNWFSCPPSKIIEAVDKIRDQIDLLPPVYIIDEGVESDLFVIGERLSFRWFPFTQTASHLDLVGKFIQELIKDIENDVDVLAKCQQHIKIRGFS